MATMGSSRLPIILSCCSLLLLSFATLTLSAEDVYFECRYAEENKGNFTDKSTYQSNLNDIISQLSNLTDFNYGFHNLSAGGNPDKVFATALCAGDKTPNECRTCFNYTITKLIERCPWGKEVVAWSQFCMVRYANRDIFAQLDSDPRTCVYNPVNASNPDVFNQALSNLLTNLSNEASTGGALRKYAADNTTDDPQQMIFAAVQCTPDLNQENCSLCLNFAMSELSKCCAGRLGCRVLRPSCVLRFETGSFFNLTAVVPVPSPPPSSLPSPPPPPPSTLATIGGKKNNTARTIVIVIASVVGTLILVIVAICIFSKQRMKTIKVVENADEITRAESLQFDFDSILDATNNFSEANKLGQGGFGVVYKGRLPNGQEIAVKRLSMDSGQGDLEFKNEVLLVAKLQHRNLVRLLGFCLQGQERLLIYEFVRNASLDHFIFDPIKHAQLDWEKRYKIIGGIARGLLYLHEDSRLRIIHRDLKPSNILLDSEMIPKIADFGMARLFRQDETQGTTSRVVGTYGYMAPEYIINGQFSVKSDVFSFGVLILEIISGQKSNRFRQGEHDEYLLNFAWKNWREGTAMNLIDPNLGNSSRDEMMRCIHIGLLCVQENVAARPTMNFVVLMLSSSSTTLPVPTQPAFTTQTNFESDISFSLGTNSSMSDPNQSRIEVLTSQNEASITKLYPR